MTGWLWVMVGALCLTCYGLGCISARAGFIHRKEKGEALTSNSRANAILAVFFTMVAVAMAINAIYLQVNIKREMDGQIACNTATSRVNTKIARERANLDSINAEYEIAHFQFQQIFLTDPLVDSKDPRYIKLQEISKKLIDARLQMTKTYAENPYPNC